MSKTITTNEVYWPLPEKKEAKQSLGTSHENHVNFTWNLCEKFHVKIQRALFSQEQFHLVSCEAQLPV